MLVTRRVHSSLEPSGPSSRSLSQFQEHEKTRGIAATSPPPPRGEGLIHFTDNTPCNSSISLKAHWYPFILVGREGGGAKVCKVSAQGHHGCSSTELNQSNFRVISKFICDTYVSFRVYRFFYSHNWFPHK